MTTDTNYIILTATLNVKKQMQFVFLCTFCLSLICFGFH